MKAAVWPLPPPAEVMCGRCMRKATHFVIKTYADSDLLAMCWEHAMDVYVAELRTP